MLPASRGLLVVEQKLGSTEKGIVDYSPNGEVAKRIASVTPYFPFKGIERFYDIGGFLKDPEAFQLAIDVFVERYRGKNIDSMWVRCPWFCFRPTNSSSPEKAVFHA